MESAGESGRKKLAVQAEKFKKLLAELEDLLDSGFFVSVMGRVVIDERRAFEILNAMRALDFDIELEEGSPAGYSSPAGRLPDNADEMVRRVYAEAQNIRRGADQYARKSLDDLGERLDKMLRSVREGIRVLDDRLEKNNKGLASEEAKRVADDGGR